MPYTWTDDATAVGELVDPDKLNDNLMHLKYDLVGGKASTSGDTFTGDIVMSGASIDEAKGADIASASSIDLGAATGNLVYITGTTAITALGTAQAGIRREVIFSGILTLTYNATSLILPGKADITTAVGDFATFISLGSGNWACVKYVSVDGGTSTGDQFTEYANLAAFPATGAANKYYIALDSGVIYRWTGSAYASISSGDGLDAAGVRAVALTGLSTATATVITAEDTVLTAPGKLQGQVTAIWGETKMPQVFIAAGETPLGMGFIADRSMTVNSLYFHSVNNSFAPDAPTSLTVAVHKMISGTLTLQATTAAITTAAATDNITDFDVVTGDLIVLIPSNTTGVENGIFVGLAGVRKV